MRPKSEHITKREAEKLLASDEWEEDREMATVIGLKSYRNSRGQSLIMLFGRSGADLCDQRDALLDYYRSARQEPPKHLLVGRFPYDQSFPDAVPRLVDELSDTIGIQRTVLDGSEQSLDVVETAVRRIGYQQFLSEKRFASLVAYIGEVIRLATNGQWYMRQSGNVWEPWIKGSDGRLHPPFAIVYKELIRGRSGSIRGAVNGEIHAHLLG